MSSAEGTEVWRQIKQLGVEEFCVTGGSGCYDILEPPREKDIWLLETL